MKRLAVQKQKPDYDQDGYIDRITFMSDSGPYPSAFPTPETYSGGGGSFGGGGASSSWDSGSSSSDFGSSDSGGGSSE
jgi:hypothetical protein